MYESGLSNFARFVFLIIAVLLGWMLISLSGCSSAYANNQVEEYVIETPANGAHHFF